jgi:hypothetical protein
MRAMTQRWISGRAPTDIVACGTGCESKDSPMLSGLKGAIQKPRQHTGTDN